MRRWWSEQRWRCLARATTRRLGLIGVATGLGRLTKFASTCAPPWQPPSPPSTRSRPMTTKTDLPPLPERFDCTNGSAQWCYVCYTMTRDDLGDYVLAEDYDALRSV